MIPNANATPTTHRTACTIATVRVGERAEAVEAVDA
jgi:hypothetical protein